MVGRLEDVVVVGESSVFGRGRERDGKGRARVEVAGDGCVFRRRLGQGGEG